MKRRDEASNPRTYSSDWSGDGVCPQPRRWPDRLSATWAAVNHCTSSGLAAVLLKPEICSRTCVYVYATFQPNAFGPVFLGDKRMLNCAVRDCTSLRSSVTRANDWDTRSSWLATVPVPP